MKVPMFEIASRRRKVATQERNGMYIGFGAAYALRNSIPRPVELELEEVPIYSATKTRLEFSDNC